MSELHLKKNRWWREARDSRLILSMDNTKETDSASDMQDEEEFLTRHGSNRPTVAVGVFSRVGKVAFRTEISR